MLIQYKYHKPLQDSDEVVLSNLSDEQIKELSQRILYFTPTNAYQTHQITVTFYQILNMQKAFKYQVEHYPDSNSNVSMDLLNQLTTFTLKIQQLKTGQKLNLFWTRKILWAALNAEVFTVFIGFISMFSLVQPDTLNLNEQLGFFICFLIWIFHLIGMVVVMLIDGFKFYEWFNDISKKSWYINGWQQFNRQFKYVFGWLSFKRPRLKQVVIESTKSQVGDKK